MSPIRGKRVANETSGAFDVTSPHSDGVSAGAGYGYGYGYDYGNGGGEGTGDCPRGAAISARSPRR
ncbi:hypothetical protein ACUWEX_08940 [Okibacterium fritillariae]|uniref:hypothetical protein n=1 Tax=Okibacterium fritillariae TaxID=123320 RepID=UPI001181127D|nr:hypothetical protein [Okibacterium fritillariae]